MMIYVHAALEVQLKEPTKKVMMIFQEPVNEHCKYDDARIEFEEEEMDNLSRGLSVGSFNFGIGLWVKAYGCCTHKDLPYG